MLRNDETESSSPLETNSPKLSATTDFLFLLPTSHALYKGMFNITKSLLTNVQHTTYSVEMTYKMAVGL